jgi:hypothetical protein
LVAATMRTKTMLLNCLIRMLPPLTTTTAVLLQL